MYEWATSNDPRSVQHTWCLCNIRNKSETSCHLHEFEWNLEISSVKAQMLCCNMLQFSSFTCSANHSVSETGPACNPVFCSDHLFTFGEWPFNTPFFRCCLCHRMACRPWRSPMCLTETLWIEAGTPSRSSSFCFPSCWFIPPKSTSTEETTRTISSTWGNKKTNWETLNAKFPCIAHTWEFDLPV